MPRKKKEIAGVEMVHIYELMEMDLETIKAHFFAVNEAVVWYQQQADDVSRYKYRVEMLMKTKNWLAIEDNELNG